jgi:lipid-A-disaccharide synthase-like uncharacterized protein
MCNCNLISVINVIFDFGLRDLRDSLWYLSVLTTCVFCYTVDVSNDNIKVLYQCCVIMYADIWLFESRALTKETVK